ncbi:MAG: flagellar hook-length control protein FliK [Lachnospiraceae bacterium]|nr:flagellar hook-length control protein FliK [Lachnospiraceae bacterium]
MGINAIASEKYTADNASKSTVKKQSNDFKSLMDMAVKKQRFEKAEEKSNCDADSKTDTKTDRKAGNEVKPQKNEEDEANKKDEVFENEKNSFFEQAFLARNVVDVVNIEIEPVQEAVLTAAVENGVIIPQIGEVPSTDAGQETALQNVAGEEVLGKANIIKAPEDNTKTTTDVVKDEKATFKLADTMHKEVIPEKKNSEADMNLDDSKAQVQNQEKAQDDVPNQKAVGELKVEGENIYAKKDNLEINSEAQIVASPDKDVIVIKVADPVTPSTGKELAEKLGDEIVVKLDSGANEFQAVLNPKGLGEIAVKLSVESGKIMVSMTCSNETTKALLENNVSSLVKIVEGNMGQETVVNVYNEKDSGQENFDGHGNKGQYQGNSQHNQGDNDETETDFIQKLRLGILEMEEV